VTLNRPAEVFGYPIENRGAEAQSVRDRYECPFVGDQCIKKSRLVTYPMGVCSVSVGDAIVAICPRRLLQGQIVFRDIALDYFGSTDNLLLFSEIGLRGVGTFDYVFANLSNRYQPSFAPGSAQTNVFAVYDLARSPEVYVLSLQRFVSASVDSLFAALRQNQSAPSKDQFVAHLEARIKRQKPRLRLDF
jgi:hypothetical protein